MPKSPRSGNSVISSKSLDPDAPPWRNRYAVSVDRMRIVDLNNEPWHIARLSRWHHREWVQFYPDEQVADFARDLNACLGEQLVPSTFIATDGRLLGSASLLASDMLTHPELSPWVASVYVRRARQWRSQCADPAPHGGGGTRRLALPLPVHARSCRVLSAPGLGGDWPRVVPRHSGDLDAGGPGYAALEPGEAPVITRSGMQSSRECFFCYSAVTVFYPNRFARRAGAHARDC